MGSLNPVDITITQAYTDQTRPIGWDNMLRGRLSLLWGKAFDMYTASTKQSMSASGVWLIKKLVLFWEYSHSLWEHHNGIVHGNTVEETKATELKATQQVITAAYEEYKNDPFIVRSHLRYLFTS